MDVVVALGALFFLISNHNIRQLCISLIPFCVISFEELFLKSQQAVNGSFKFKQTTTDFIFTLFPLKANKNFYKC